MLTYTLLILHFWVFLFSRLCRCLVVSRAPWSECLPSGPPDGPWPLWWRARGALLETATSKLAEGLSPLPSDAHPWLWRAQEKSLAQFLQQSSRGVLLVVCVVICVVKCKRCYLFLPLCSGVIWPCGYPARVVPDGYDRKTIFPNFYKLPNVYLQACWMIYF